jgi:5-(carboxyamino)imidazole ribonucleotide synthase
MHTTDALVTAAYDDTAAIATLIEQCDVITFEFEAVPDVTLAQLQSAALAGDVRVYPSTDVMTLIKDKGRQKTWLSEQGLPTLPFVLLDKDEGVAAIKAAGLSAPVVQKTCQGGYDGRGVQVLVDDHALAALWPVESVIEPALDLQQCIEVAVVIAQDADGTQIAYPPVSMDFDPVLNSVKTVVLPARVAEDIQDQCFAVAKRAVASLGSVGVFAVEMFVTPEKAVYINEISPRVHNSGHLTMDAFDHCQFEQHLRAICGLPLAPIKPRSSAGAMLNLLYEDAMAPAQHNRPYSVTLAEQGPVVLHWYGKEEARSGRKMGHINALADNAASALLYTEVGLAKLIRGELPSRES